MPEKNASYTFRDERIFSDGVQLVPMVITKENGTVVMMWVVDEFVDDGQSFQDGYPVSPKTTADNVGDLINGGDVDDDEDEE